VLVRYRLPVAGSGLSPIPMAPLSSPELLQQQQQQQQLTHGSGPAGSSVGASSGARLTLDAGAAADCAQPGPITVANRMQVCGCGCGCEYIVLCVRAYTRLCMCVCARASVRASGFLCVCTTL
jgi:hypothetical protein